MVAVDLGPRLQARQVGARVGFGESLTPDDVATQDPGQMICFLRLAAAGDQRRAGVLQADEPSGDLGGADAGVLLVPDELLHEGGAAAAELLRPRDASPAGVVHAALPGHVVLAAGTEVGDLRPRVARDVGLQPGTSLGTEGLFGVAESDLDRLSPGCGTRA